MMASEGIRYRPDLVNLAVLTYFVGSPWTARLASRRIVRQLTPSFRATVPVESSRALNLCRSNAWQT